MKPLKWYNAWMGEIIARVFLSLAILGVVIPIACFFATPYVLLRPIFLEVENRSYWREVRDEYMRLVRSLLDWGDMPL